MMEPIDSIFTEKYRPPKVNGIVGDFKSKILKYLDNPKAIPHFLFHSKTPGTGKCLTGDNIFFTNNGMTSFNNYCTKYSIIKEKTDIVDSVYCPINKGSKTEYFYKGKEQTIKIMTKQGYTLEGTPKHKIKIFDLQEGMIWKQLSNITENDIIPIFYNTQIFGNNNYLDYTKFNKLKKKNDNKSIMINKPKELNKNISYLLGVFIANGNFNGTGVGISTFKPWLHKKILKILLTEFGIKGKIRNYSGQDEGIIIPGVWFQRFLENVCFIKKATARNKSIPLKIMEASKENQLYFIYGLMEDSWISKEGYIDYSTASYQLASEFKYMMLNIGYIVKHTTKYLEEYKHTYHSLTLSTEHSRDFLSFFDMIYKNKEIIYKKNMNTNILSYSNLLQQFVINKRKENKIRKCDIYALNLVKRNFIRGSFKKVNSILPDLMKESYLKESIQLFLENNIFLDTVCNVKKYSKTDIYDFHIPKTHSFLANGIINHNTTLAKAIINELGCDYIIINSSDDRKIDTIRDKVKQFSLTKSSKNGLKRCVFMDEFDGMLKGSQEALRNIMETYAQNVFFILTCNNINKVIDPLKSRCKVLPFGYPDKSEIYKYLETICVKEEMEYSEKGINALIDYNYPNIRNCVITLQDLKTEGQSVTPEYVKPATEELDKMWELLQKKDWKTIKTKIMESTIDPREVNTYFWMKALRNNPPLIKILQMACRNEKDIAWGADPRIIFVSSLIEMVK